MSVTDEVLRANQKYAQDFDRGELPMPPARKLAVVTCMMLACIPKNSLALT